MEFNFNLWQFILVFSAAQFINVILNTVKTIVMYKQDKLSSSLINAICYGFYTVIVVFMAGEMDLWLKIVLTALTNFVGVWVSMVIIEKVNKKHHKDKLWIITATARPETMTETERDLIESQVKYNFMATTLNGVKSCGVFNIYAYTQEDSTKVKAIIEKYNLKYNVQESTIRL